MFKITRYIAALSSLVISHSLWASTTVTLYSTEKPTESLGTVTITETMYGLLFSPQLKGLVPGTHGFHIHQNPSCDDKGMAAGGHYDPNNTNKHLGPYDTNGHLGDLPALSVDADGSATVPLLAPRLKSIAEIKNHALMIHEGGDTYSDTPKLGGGGARIECGVI